MILLNILFRAESRELLLCSEFQTVYDLQTSSSSSYATILEEFYSKPKRAGCSSDSISHFIGFRSAAAI